MKIRIYDPDSQDIRTSLESIFSKEFLNKFFPKYTSECEELSDSVILSTEFTILELTKSVFSYEQIGECKPSDFNYICNSELIDLLNGFLYTPIEMSKEQAIRFWELWKLDGYSFCLDIVEK